VQRHPGDERGGILCAAVCAECDRCSADPRAQLHTKREAGIGMHARKWVSVSCGHLHAHMPSAVKGVAPQGAAPAPSKRKREAPALRASWMVWIWLDTTLSTSASMRLPRAPHRVVHTRAPGLPGSPSRAAGAAWQRGRSGLELVEAAPCAALDQAAEDGAHGLVVQALACTPQASPAAQARSGARELLW